VKENSIEETIKQLKLMLKVRKEQKEIIECAGGSCMNCNPDIKALIESIDILSDYKRVLKENEELLEVKVSTSAHNRILELEKENEELNKYTIHLTDEQYKTVIDLAQNEINQQWIQKVKDKISERQFELQQEYKDFEDDAILIVLQELLEGRK
jgi:predicted metal-binding protein